MGGAGDDVDLGVAGGHVCHFTAVVGADQFVVGAVDEQEGDFIFREGGFGGHLFK